MTYKIYGLVQGVGFRPYVAKLADSLSLKGYVKNSGGIVTLCIIGDKKAMDDLLHRLFLLDGFSSDLPGAKVERIEEVPSEPEPEYSSFSIIESSPESDEIRILPPDIATCPTCLSEMRDPSNRRYRHPFISCISCGPRFSIMRSLPYDRDTITMGAFSMCPSCAEEYHSLGDRRHFAQTIACPDCGPRVTLISAGLPVGWTLKYSFSLANFLRGLRRLFGRRPANSRKALRQCSSLAAMLAPAGEIRKCSKEYFRARLSGSPALAQAIEALKDGKIVAIKDIGGYHLAGDAFSPEVRERLTEWKNRERKPFAVMFPSVESIREYAQVSETEEKLLTSNAAPIVLLHPLQGKWHEDRVGAFLPSNPLQHLILSETGPLIMTSANRGGEPIIIDDREMKALLKTGLPDMILFHDREILTPLDDSIHQVVKLSDGREIVQTMRRARGYVPEPLFIDRVLPEDTFAAGGDLKAVFALGRKNAVYLSGHFSDLIDIRCREARSLGISHMSGLLGIEPIRVAIDKHPVYYSARDVLHYGIEALAAEKSLSRSEALAVGKIRAHDSVQSTDFSRKQSRNQIINRSQSCISIQHHHAHIASVMAEHGLQGPVIGIAMDGTGYGDDGTIWGGEILICEDGRYERMGHISPVTLVGADTAAKDAVSTSICYMEAAVASGYLTREEAERYYVDKPKAALIRAAIEGKVNTHVSTSTGRLFDAVSAMLGICPDNSYEGECAVRLQYAAEKAAGSTEVITPENTLQLFAGIYKRKAAGEAPEKTAYLFHKGLAAWAVEKAAEAAEKAGTDRIALSGGTMQNSLLLRLLYEGLEEKGYKVYTNEKVPCGDGGLALGQIYLATC